MEHISLPKDIRKHVRKSVLTRLLKFLILAGISFCLLYILNNRLMEKCHVIVYTGIQLFIFILPFWLTGVPFKLIDRSWCGTVKAIDIKEETGTYSAVNLRSFPYTKHSIYLTVELKNGKLIRSKVKEYGTRSHNGFPVPFEGNIQHHMNDYMEGDIVYHFYGLTELLVVSQKQTSTANYVNCVVCGSQNPKKSSHCHCCGHSLLHTLIENPTSLNGDASS